MAGGWEGISLPSVFFLRNVTESTLFSPPARAESLSYVQVAQIHAWISVLTCPLVKLTSDILISFLGQK